MSGDTEFNDLAPPMPQVPRPRFSPSPAERDAARRCIRECEGVATLCDTLAEVDATRALEAKAKAIGARLSAARIAKVFGL